MFDMDFHRLDRVARALRLLRWIAGASALVILASAPFVWPGTPGNWPDFWNVQVHLDLLDYFSRLGLEMSRYDDRALLGMRFGQFEALLRLLSLPAAILGLAALLRLRWRQVLLYGCLWYGLSSLPDMLMVRGGWQVSNPRDFGVAEGMPAANKVGPVHLEPLKPIPMESFGALRARLGAQDGARDTWMDDYRRSVEVKEKARKNRAQTIRMELFSPMTDLQPGERAAMHYMAAQVGYLENDPRRVGAQLNAISPRDFHPTFDSDWRIRRMQEWAERHGQVMAPGAYRPVTGWSLTTLRLMAKILASLGGVALLLYATLARLSLIVSKRVRRMRRMAEELIPPRRQTVADPVSGFGKREVKPGRLLETKIST